MRWTVNRFVVALALSGPLAGAAWAQQQPQTAQPAAQQSAQQSTQPATETVQAAPRAGAREQLAMLAPLRCADPIARIASVQGQVELRDLRTANWQRAQLNEALCLNDHIRVGPNSRASFQYFSDVTVQLDQNTYISLVEAKDKVSIWTQMWRGALHFITRSRRPFRVITPFVNASVEGTEVYIALAKDRADLTVFEGKLDVANDAGQVLLSSGESALVQGLESIPDDDQFRQLRAEAPRKVLIAKPRDAVQWALYYPPVIDVRPGENVHPNLKAASEQFRGGNTAEAFAELDKVPADSWDAQYFIYRASLLLYVGREQEAQAELAQALQKDDARKSDALALQTIIAIVQNDKERGLSLAQQAVQADPSSAAAQIALSYAQQAIFKLELALASAEQAATLDANNALAYARIAELQLSQADLDKALAAAKKAAELNPNLARTQSILGFSYLTRIDTKNAKETFAKAIALDSADPLPHLGLGLAKIREGKLAEGRQDIEQAVILDPNNSLIRSYVGKAYYEEKRHELAGKQFEIAKELDPNDPTPWFYGAIQEQATNQPIQAIADLERSITLNDKRAPYRSRLLLDQDHATRQVSVARLFETVGMDSMATSTATASVAQDPSNYSAHQFLSEVYAARDRHEIARASELLQAQLLQPLSLNPVSPQLPYTDLSLPAGASRTSLFEREYASMFESNRLKFSVGGLLGSRDTHGSELILSGLSDRFSGSIGRFAYSTDGFRRNSDIAHEIYNAFGAVALSPDLTLQLEFRKRDTKHGDISLSFDPDFLRPDDRRTIKQDGIRTGLAFRPSTKSVFLATLARNRAKFEDIFIDPGVVEGNELFDDKARLSEVQYQRLFSRLSLVAGGGYSEVDTIDASVLDFTASAGTPCAPDLEPCDTRQRFLVRQWNSYLYAQVAPSPPVSLTLGVSREAYEDDSQAIEKWNPKIGVRIALSPDVTFRAAGLRTLKRALITHQTIEPTQIAGFNQFYDDAVGSLNKLFASALDFRVSDHVSAGAEIRRQDSSIFTGTAGPALSQIPTQHLRTESVQFDANWRASQGIAFSIGAGAERFTWDTTISQSTFPTYLRTLKLPMGLRLFLNDSLYGEAIATSVWQKVERLAAAPVPVGKDQFVLLDLSVGYRLPRRLGVISLEIKNALDAEFSYQDDNFRSTELRLSPYLPVRRVFLKTSLVF